jgi:hypothetical protein
LPSYKELATIINDAAHFPDVDLSTFPTMASTAYWTASNPGGGGTLTIDFSNGTSSADVMSAYAKCIR